MPQHFADVLSLQRLAGNSRTSQSVQRARRRDSDDSDLAYGSDHRTPSPVEQPFSGSIGGVRFTSERSGQLMGQIFDFVADVSSYFSTELSRAGSITVQLGRTQGGTPGEWRAGSRTIVLSSRMADPVHLGGTAVFEILNAAADASRVALDAAVRGGHIDADAEAAGWDPAQYYAMEVERIEYNNGMRHRDIMNAAGVTGGANLFANEGDFNTFYQRQVASGHTHSYEFRYALLREEARAAAARRREQEQARAQESGSSRSGRRGESSSHGSHSSHGRHRESGSRRHRR
ncbi:hypothetical protein ACWC9S_07740 [Streptomyces xiamenensis]